MKPSVACAVAVLLLGLAWGSSAQGGEIYVTPNGTPGGQGTKESPLDLKSAFTNVSRLTPGTTVWIAGGRYEVGTLIQSVAVNGTKDRPIIFRALPGQRATVIGGFQPKGNHLWLWGLEITGPNKSGVNVDLGSNGIKVINCVIHDCGPAQPPQERKPSGQGIGGWDTGNDHEFYGNIIYHNGWNNLDHGIYSQNQPRHTTKRYIANIIFENAGCGFHIYGSAPFLANLHLEGNIAFATSVLARHTEPNPGQMNILVGGAKPLSNVVVRQNCTYHPIETSKRGVDIGYTGAPNRNILVEDNYFMCGINAMELKGVGNAIVRNNTFWAPNGMVAVTFASAEKLATETAGAKVEGEPKVVFENNRYIDNGKFDLARFQAQIKSGQTDRIVPGRNGRPHGLHVFKYVNQYEPERVHLAVYNWDRQDVVRVDLEGILKAGDAYRVVNVLDFYGPPVAEGRAQGAFIMLPMKGHRHEPEFGAYVLFRPVPEAGTK